MVFSQKPRDSIMLTDKNTQGYCQPTKESVCYNLSLHMHDEDHIHHPQILKLDSRTHIEWILNRDKEYKGIVKKTF